MVESVKGSQPRVTRAERARLTRRAIVEAAVALFLEHGYGATTLAQVAARAGVAVQTVYFHYGNKAALLKEALDVAAVGDDEPVPLLERPWVRQIQAEPDPRRVIALWVAQGRVILERVAPILSLVRGAMGTDPDLAAQWRVNEEQRRTAYRFLVALLNDRHALRPGLSADEAADLAFLVESAENYLVATTVLGWSPARWEQTTTRLQTSALLGPPPA
jgi:AcrR family transcriptional regulator